MNALKQNLFAAIDFLLRVEEGPDKGKAYRLHPPMITVGRDPQCQITLTDPKVSRQQLRIHFKNNIVCEDLSSRKTTFINGRPCGPQTVLKPGDKITFGQTQLSFHAKANEKAKPQLAGATANTKDQLAKKKGQKNFRLFIVVIVIMMTLLFLLDSPPETAPSENLATVSDLKKQIEESEQRMALLREARAEKNKLADEKQLYYAENHFIAGFRDFQNGLYTNALTSFETTISVDRDHTRAQLYSKSARKKREDIIDTHLRDGEKYKAKLMYNRCAAEYEKALIFIDNRTSKKYQLAKTQLEECRLLQSGGYK